MIGKQTAAAGAVEASPHTNISPERQKTGKFLYRFAWGIEILAVLIGLLIALMQGPAKFFDENKELNFAEWVDTAIAVTPFIMLALVEITKIPFVDAFYRTSHRVWKRVFLISLLLISFITFESALNGFQRVFSRINSELSVIDKQIVELDESIVGRKNQIKDAQELTMEKIRKEEEDALTGLKSTLDSKKKTNDDQIKQLKASINTEITQGLADEILALNTEIGDLEKRRDGNLDQLKTDRDNKTEKERDKDQDERGRLATALQDEKKALEAIRIEENQKIENSWGKKAARNRAAETLAAQNEKISNAEKALKDFSDEADQREISREERFKTSQKNIRDSNQALINPIETERSNVQAKFDTARTASAQDVDTKVRALEEEIGGFQEKYNLDAAAVTERTKTRQGEFVTKQENIEDWNGKNRKAEADILVLRNDFNVSAGENQIHSIASYFSDEKSAVDIPKELVTRVALVWFLSLAAMIAFTGPILAMAANVIRDPRIPDYRSKDDRQARGRQFKTLRSFRRWIIYHRRLDRKPIIKERIREVTKEVPVDRVVKEEVIKEVPVDRVVKHEVPVQTIKKELVHVPLYTNDPKLLKMGIKKDDLEED
jgi:hypothetical protein